VVVSPSVAFVAASAALAIALVARPASGQANYKLAPVGGRTTLVGGTGLAFGRDSASAFLNPATVVRLDPGRLAFSVNFYELTLFTSKTWYQPGAVDTARFGDLSGGEATITTAGFDSLPGSLCLFLRVGELAFLARGDRKEFSESRARLGLCLASVQNSDFGFNREDYQQETATGHTRQAQSIRQTFRRIAVGPTYAMYITNALAFGASLHVSRTGFRSVFESTATSTGPGGRSITSAFFNSAHGDSYDLSATVGLTYRIGRFQTVAFALEAPSLHVFGPGGLNRFTTSQEGATNRTQSITAEGQFAAYTPLRFGLGTGVEYSWGSAELNVSYHQPLGSAYRATLDGRVLDSNNGVANDRPATLELSNRGHGAVNIGVGGHVNVAPYVSLLAGLGTDLSTARAGTIVGDPMAYFPSRTHRVTTSVGLGSHGEGGDLLVGGELAYEWGDRLAVNSYQVPARFDAAPSQNIGLLIVIAGTTSFKAIRRAVNDLSNSVDVSPKKPEPKKPEPPPPLKSGPDTKG
jgi:hypothetical protein